MLINTVHIEKSANLASHSVKRSFSACLQVFLYFCWERNPTNKYVMWVAAQRISGAVLLIQVKKSYKDNDSKKNVLFYHLMYTLKKKIYYLNTQ